MRVLRTVHLFLGLAGSGKSTLARQLAADGAAVRFTLDEWMIRLYPGLGIDAPEYGERASNARELIWSVAEQVLLTGADVVLDWNSWSRERRAWAVERAGAVGAQVVLHVLGVSIDLASSRAADRTAAGAPHSHAVTRAGNVHLERLIEPPDESEGLVIVRH